jgi:nitroreductase
MNMQLAAWDKGIGSVWLTVGSVPPAAPVLQVKEDHTVVALLAFGYPKETPPAPPREDFRARTVQLP